MATYKIYKKTSATEKEEVRIPYNVLSNPPDLSVYAKKADAETISGVWTFTGTPKMDTLENSKGNAMYHFNAERVFFGQTTFPITLRGSLARPQYTTDGTTYKDLALASDVPSAVTSIDGLAGGTLTSPLKVTGGDGANASKIALNNGENGQITDSGTSTIFGFMNATDLTMGSSSYNARLRGKETRPKYNSNDLALYSDVPTKVSELTNDSGYTTNKGTVTQVKIGDETKSPDDTGLVDLGTPTASKVANVLNVSGTENNSVRREFDYDGSEYKMIYFPPGSFSLTQRSSGKGTGLTVNLANTGVTEGKYNNVHVNSQGRVTSAENVDYAEKSDLAAVATSGSYNDLADKPTIPSETDNSKHGYTELTNENLNSIMEVGWYRAASGNTCTHRPSDITDTMPFILEIEKSKNNYAKQTLYKIGPYSTVEFTTYVRYSVVPPASWSPWVKQQTMSDGEAQTFSGFKTFSSGINVSKSLQFSGNSGSSSQFAMSQGGSLAPKWVNLQVKVNGTTYTADSSGLIDLGTISGGTQTTSFFNDIY